MVFSIFGKSTASNAEDDDSTTSDDEAQAPPGKIRPVDSTTRQMTQAERIDAHFAKLAEEDAEKALRGNRKLQFNPNIKPSDREWSDFRETLIVDLARESVDTVMKAHFECDKGQNLYVIPPIQAGIILDIQARNSKDYKALLAPGGRFHGQPDNLVTKLTMLKFGLPIAPITVKNIDNRSNSPNEDDPPDDPNDFPRLRRIEYAEKPLEFLGVYNERSYGWKILRREKPSQPLGGVSELTNKHTSRSQKSHGNDNSDDDSSEEEAYRDNDDDPEDRSKNDEVFSDARMGSTTHNAGLFLHSIQLPHYQPKPIQPVGNIQSSMRGGTGPPGVSDEPKNTGYIYSLQGGRATISDDINSFIEKSLQLLGLDSNTAWEFVVEQYDNRGHYKDHTFKPKWQKGPGASNIVTKTDPSAWEDIIKHRIFHPREHWRMAVRRTSEATRPYLHAATANGVGKLATGEPSTSNIQAAKVHAGAGGAGADQVRDHGARSKFQENSSDRTPHFVRVVNKELDVAILQNPTFESLTRLAAPHAIGIDASSVNWEMYFVLYTANHNDKNSRKKEFKLHQFYIMNRLSVEAYNQSIAPKITSPNKEEEWVVMVCSTQDEPLQSFELAEDSDEEASKLFTKCQGQIFEAYVRGKSVSLEHKGIFLRTVLDALGLPEYLKWRFAVDCFSRAPSETVAIIQDTLDITEDSLVAVFGTEISSRAQDKSQDWFFVARLPDDIVEESFESPGAVTKGKVCGYAGQIFTTSNANSILEAAHSLLSFEEDGRWSFLVGLYQNQSTRSQVLKVSVHDWSESFEQRIKPCILEEDWIIFVRDEDHPEPSTIEPPNSIDIVHLTFSDKGIAYWKVPKDMEPGYGINQPQEDFFRAMKLFFQPNSRPAHNVIIQGIDIGFGGMYVTTELWSKVRSDIKNRVLESKASESTPEGLRYEVTLKNQAPNAANIEGIRLVGSTEFGCAVRGDFSQMMSEIVEIAENVVPKRTLPTNFRIWKQADNRENGEAGKVLRFGHSDAEISALQEWYETSHGPTSCVQYRPDWKTFNLSELEPPGSTVTWKWDTTIEWTLASFEKSLFSHYQDQVDLTDKSIEIREPQTGTRYILSGNITEDEWRKHVYDWFTTPNLRIQPIKDMQYIIDTTTQWALPPNFIARAAGTSRRHNGPSPKNATRITSVQPSTKFDRFNKDRTNLAHTVSKKIAPLWNVWTEAQNLLDKTQHNTYYSPQPIVEPGKAPDAPLFAESKEVAIMVGDHTPTAYASVLTPTDVRHLQNSRRRLLNQVLEREVSCAICTTTFEAYNTQEIEKHYRTHQRAIHSAGDCVLCGDRNWRFWSAKQKKEHLYDHQARHESTIAKTFWASLECPGCDVDLSKLGDKNQVLNHVISHDPQTVQYCDCCSRPYKFCTTEELTHHTEVCIDAEIGESGYEPTFCKSCGVNTSEWAEHDQAKNHCSGEAGQFCCGKCGFDLTTLRFEERLRHNADCRAPGGEPKSFCGRCGVHFTTLKDNSLIMHSQTCKSAVYTQPTILKHVQAKFDELEALRLENSVKDAIRRKAISVLRRKEKCLAAREADIKRKEASLGICNPDSVPSDYDQNAHFSHESNNFNTIEEPNVQEVRRKRAQMEENAEENELHAKRQKLWVEKNIKDKSWMNEIQFATDGQKETKATPERISQVALNQATTPAKKYSATSNTAKTDSITEQITQTTPRNGHQNPLFSGEKSSSRKSDYEPLSQRSNLATKDTGLWSWDTDVGKLETPIPVVDRNTKNTMVDKLNLPSIGPRLDSRFHSSVIVNVSDYEEELSEGGGFLGGKYDVMNRLQKEIQEIRVAPRGQEAERIHAPRANENVKAAATKAKIDEEHRAKGNEKAEESVRQAEKSIVDVDDYDGSGLTGYGEMNSSDDVASDGYQYSDLGLVPGREDDECGPDSREQDMDFLAQIHGESFEDTIFNARGLKAPKPKKSKTKADPAKRMVNSTGKRAMKNAKIREKPAPTKGSPGITKKKLPAKTRKLRDDVPSSAQATITTRAASCEAVVVV